jgi:integrase
MPHAPEKLLLDDRKLRAMKPAMNGDRRTVYDTGVKGLCVRVGARGPAFYVVKRDPLTRKFRWIRLGDFPVLDLKTARERARNALAAIAENKPIPSPVERGVSFADAVAQYVAECLGGKRTRREIEANLARAVEVLGTRPACELRHEDFVTFLKSIANRTERNGSGTKLLSGGPHAAAKVKSALSPLFRWAAFNRIAGITSNPLAAIPNSELLRGKVYNRARGHVPNEQEIRTIWQAATEYGYPYGDLVKGLIRTGLRLEELAHARRSEIRTLRWEKLIGGERVLFDGPALVIPAARMKGAAEHVLPLTSGMIELIEGLPEFSRGDFLFSSTFGEKPLAGFSKYQSKLHRKIAAIGPVRHWALHDLRRVCRSGMSRVGVIQLHAELVLAHKRRGIEGHYDTWEFLPEKLAALESWEQLLDRIINPPPNMIQLARAAV